MAPTPTGDRGRRDPGAHATHGSSRAVDRDPNGGRDHNGRAECTSTPRSSGRAPNTAGPNRNLGTVDASSTRRARPNARFVDTNNLRPNDIRAQGKAARDTLEAAAVASRMRS